MTRLVVIVWLGVSLTAAFAITATRASAMPPLARKYHTPCSTCHTQPPQLNAFGEAFRMNGYQWPQDGDDRGRIKDAPLAASPDANRDAFPNAFLPSDIPYLPAIGFQAEFTSAYNLPNPDGNVSFNGTGSPLAPPLAKYNSAGELDWSHLQDGVDLFVIGRAAKNLTYFADLDLYSPQMTVNIARAMFVWSNILGPSSLNLKVGRFEPEISFLSNFRKLVGDAWDISSRSIGEPSGWSPESVSMQPGAEASGNVLCGRLRYNVGALTNYTGTPTSLGGNGAGLQNNALDIYAHVATKLGGLRLDGVERNATAAAEPAPAQPVTTSWADDAVWLGAYGYRGHHDVNLAIAYPGLAPDGIVVDQGDVFYRVGGDIKVTHGRFWLVLAEAYERHELSGASLAIPANKVSGSLSDVEAEYMVYPWFIPYCNFDYYTGSNPYLVNNGWGGVGYGVSPLPIRPGQTPSNITEWVIRPALSFAPYMNWKLYAYTELAQFPLNAVLNKGGVQLSTILVGSKLAF